MPRRRAGRVSKVGPRVQTIIDLYVLDQDSKAEKRQAEVLILISQFILLSRKRGRPRKEDEVDYAA
jgi:hypothetical protein